MKLSSAFVGLSALFGLAHPAMGALFKTSQGMSTWEIFQGLNMLTAQVSSNPNTLALLSSGGAAGSGSSVVTESQAYALFVTGAVLASWDTHATSRTAAEKQQVMDAFYGYYMGWVKMCQNSHTQSCQADQLCKSGGVSSVCLPHWKHKGDFSAPEGQGAAPDGDEDAIVGMIFAVQALANDSNKPHWYNEVRAWADASVEAFLRFNTIHNSNGRLLKLGSCWGGWGGDGNNPSYHSPGSFKIMRDYHQAYSGSRTYSSQFDAFDFDDLIDTSYKVLFATQCPAQGMVPNWARVVASNGNIVNDGGSFSGSGTPQYEFGSEAARTIWRVALDAAVYPEEQASNAAPFLQPLIARLDSGYTGGENWNYNTFTSCSAAGMSSSITVFSDWINNDFIFGPVVSALVSPSASTTATRQQSLIDAAGRALKTNVATSYYPRSWALLGSLAVGGALESAASVLSRTVTPGSPTQPAPAPTNPAPTNPAPTNPQPAPTQPAPAPTNPAPAPTNPAPAPTQASGGGSGCCSHNYKDCIDWCGTTQAQCTACGSDVVWLASPPPQTCTPRWGVCLSNPGACCPGTSCQGNQWYKQCKVIGASRRLGAPQEE